MKQALYVSVSLSNFMMCSKKCYSVALLFFTVDFHVYCCITVILLYYQSTLYKIDLKLVTSKIKEKIKIILQAIISNGAMGCI